jgi:hypothetical protein|tara:strand:+ start:739 stop:1155 length:417 start_codon:yes stop_codon:yes gene_type:complete
MSSGPKSTDLQAVQLEFPFLGSKNRRSTHPHASANRDRKLNLLRTAKARAIRLSLPFDLNEHNVEWHRVCPVLGVRLDYGPKVPGGAENSPSIDRLQPELGYVSSNVTVLSVLANRIKNNSEAATIRQVADWLESQEE